MSWRGCTIKSSSAIATIARTALSSPGMRAPDTLSPMSTQGGAMNEVAIAPTYGGAGSSCASRKRSLPNTWMSLTVIVTPIPPGPTASMVSFMSLTSRKSSMTSSSSALPVLPVDASPGSISSTFTPARLGAREPGE